MKPTRFFELLRSRRFELTDNKFNPNAESNPFIGKKGKMAMLVNLSDDDDDEGMDDFVRNRGARQGLDRVSRAHTGPHSGVMASRYDNMVRDIDDLDYDEKEHYRNPATRNFADDYLQDFEDDEDDLYKSTKDHSYERNEFNDEEDIDDFDADAGWKFMRQLNAEAGEMDTDDDNFKINYGNDEMGEINTVNGFNPKKGDDVDKMGEEEMEQEEMGQDAMNPDEHDPEEEKEKSKFEGIVRSIKGANLVSKKQQADETFTEVWIYNVGKKFSDEAGIRKGILSGTDIDPTKNFSEDGAQEAVISSIGNVQYLTLTGIPD
jgi:hypothetical protein